MAFDQTSQTGAFLPTSFVYDTSNIYALDVMSPEFKQFLVQLTETINNINLIVNIKDSGYYVTTEFVDSKMWFPDPTLSSTTTQAPSFRQEFRTCVDFGMLPNAGTTSVPHGIVGIDSTYTVTRIVGAATDPATPLWIPIPFSSPTLNENIRIDVDSTNVNITTAIDYTAFTRCFVAIEYIKN